MTDLKSTINLPSTDFPMKANLSQREPEILAYWSEINLYEKIRAKQKGKTKFILHDGPPYANGHIHIGHAVNKVLKDVIVKSKTLSDYDAPYVPGWDCHGLPIELNVEKKHGKAGQQISAETFRQLCREYANEQIDIQRNEFKRLGIMSDWNNPYITMDTKFEANIVRSLGVIIGNGHLHQGKKPVHWCVDCGSALAEAEVEYRMKTSTSIDVKFNVLDEAAVFQRCERTPHDEGKGPLSILAWTTTPWSLPGNAAITLGHDIEYVVVQCNTPFGHERFIIAESLLASCMKRYQIDEYRVLASLQGKALEGLYCQHPFYDKQVPIILGDHVTLDSGTGAVHTAPAHGVEDYLTALKYDVHFENPVGDNGCFLPTVPLFAAEHVSKSSDHIIDVLKAHNTLVHAEMMEHSYPHCWRHKTPLIYRATPQWFISMDQNGLRRAALEEVFKTQWIPDWGQARFASMLENRPDWCISRQRTWGVPITLFIHKETNEAHPNTVALIEKVANIIAKEGIDAWYSLDETTLLGEDA
ncbi:MAG: isoleucine--tRNA ligase, partial [Gammaproteobacteria bacterium]